MKCSCGIQYTRKPYGAKLSLDSIVPGWYFNCKCKSTNIWPLSNCERKMSAIVIDLDKEVERLELFVKQNPKVSLLRTEWTKSHAEALHFASELIKGALE